MSPKLIIGFMGAHKGCAKILIKLNSESLLCRCLSLFFVCRCLAFVVVCCLSWFVIFHCLLYVVVCLFVCLFHSQAG